jgi:hypothetical protein
MSAYTYNFSDTKSKDVNKTQFSLEVSNSSISETLQNLVFLENEFVCVFAQDLGAQDKEALDSLVAAHNGVTVGRVSYVDFLKKDTSNIPILALQKPVGDFDTIITHNFCDNASWPQTNDSSWILSPSAGEVFRVQKAEVQFEHDVNISGNSDELYLDYYAWVGGGAKALAQRITFKHIRDIFEYGNAHYHAPSLPEITHGLSTVIFDYANKLSFYGDDTPGSLAYLEISTKNDAQITGSYATVGFVTNTEAV